VEQHRSPGAHRHAAPRLPARPGGANLKNPPDFVKKGYAFLRGNAKPDGGIYNQALSNYNTSVAMMALLATGDRPMNRSCSPRANSSAASRPATWPSPRPTAASATAPVGTSPKRGHPDLDNTLVALEAIRTFEQLRPNAELATAKGPQLEGSHRLHRPLPE
jgi:squalene-hopene/tetraprenyl-beta-curcumene cyclase